METIRLLEMRDSPLSLDEVRAAVADDGTGGTVYFVDTVRDHGGDREVSALKYTAHPTVEVELRRIAEKVVTEFPVRALAAMHRVGELTVSEPAMIVAVACPRRAEAFEACRRLIDDIKHRLPIWKRQRFADGAQEWVAACDG
jgi:molybdopterin synthase catalytic subunit